MQTSVSAHLHALHDAIHAFDGVALRALQSQAGYDGLTLEIGFIVKPGADGVVLKPHHNTWSPPKAATSAHGKLQATAIAQEFTAHWTDVRTHLRTLVHATQHRASFVDPGRYARWACNSTGVPKELSTSVGLSFGGPHTPMKALPQALATSTGGPRKAWDTLVRRVAMLDGLSAPSPQAPFWFVTKPSTTGSFSAFERSRPVKADTAQDALAQCAVFDWPDLFDLDDLDSVTVGQQASDLSLSLLP